jgi:hypothetical protein
MANTLSASLKRQAAKPAANMPSVLACQLTKWFRSVWRSARGCSNSCLPELRWQGHHVLTFAVPPLIPSLSVNEDVIRPSPGGSRATLPQSWLWKSSTPRTTEMLRLPESCPLGVCFVTSQKARNCCTGYFRLSEERPSWKSTQHCIASAANRSFLETACYLFFSRRRHSNIVVYPSAQSDGMPGRNLRPRTAGCVSDHAEASNRCQQPTGRVDSLPPAHR